MGEMLAASALAIVFGLGFVAGRATVRRVSVYGDGNQVIVLPTREHVEIRNARTVTVQQEDAQP